MNTRKSSSPSRSRPLDSKYNNNNLNLKSRQSTHRLQNRLPSHHSIHFAQNRPTGTFAVPSSTPPTHSLTPDSGHPQTNLQLENVRKIAAHRRCGVQGPRRTLRVRRFVAEHEEFVRL